MRSRRSSKLQVMLGRLDVVELVVRRGGRIALLIDSEDSNIVAIFMKGDWDFSAGNNSTARTLKI